MIHTSKQLKDKIRNLSKGDNDKARTLIRNFMMERFLERIALSKYNRNFILKGGMLVAAMVGLDTRATMDIDTTVKALSIGEQDAERVIREICNVPVEDGITFEIASIRQIMEDFDYPGIRMMLEAKLDRMRQSIKIDISTDDVITPSAVEYEYGLMFENRSISMLTYNLETLLAEKLQTVLARGTANTRLRDFYDIYELAGRYGTSIDWTVMAQAFEATCKKRGTSFSKEDIEKISSAIISDDGLTIMWDRYKAKSYYMEDLTWKETVERIMQVIDQIQALCNAQ